MTIWFNSEHIEQTAEQTEHQNQKIKNICPEQSIPQYNADNCKSSDIINTQYKYIMYLALHVGIVGSTVDLMLIRGKKQ